jgi:cbb3-type cytochrome oxidase maturation protein
MTVLYLILPLALLIAGAAVAAFAWTVHSGQLDDVDTPPRRILFEDERATTARCAAPAASDAPGRGRHGHFRWHSS